MKHFKHTLFFAVLLGSPVAALAAPSTPSASVAVSRCWIRALPESLPSGGYFTMTNSGDRDVDLVGVQTSAFGMAMLHQTRNKGNVSTMAMVKKVTVPAHGTLSFAPGDYHVMLEKPSKPVKAGTTIPLTFVFSNGQKPTVECKVKRPGATSY
jgi:copper(I)-binding protein